MAVMHREPGGAGRTAFGVSLIVVFVLLVAAGVVLLYLNWDLTRGTYPGIILGSGKVQQMYVGFSVNFHLSSVKMPGMMNFNVKWLGISTFLAGLGGLSGVLLIWRRRRRARALS